MIWSYFLIQFFQIPSFVLQIAITQLLTLFTVIHLFFFIKCKIIYKYNLTYVLSLNLTFYLFFFLFYSQSFLSLQFLPFILLILKVKFIVCTKFIRVMHFFSFDFVSDTFKTLSESNICTYMIRTKKLFELHFFWKQINKINKKSKKDKRIKVTFFFFFSILLLYFFLFNFSIKNFLICFFFFSI